RTLAGTDQGDTWELDGVSWQQRSPGSAPSPRMDAGMTYDSGRQRTVLFGGRVGGECGALLNDTWEWNGTAWTLRTPAISPPAAAGVHPVSDSARGKTWLLAGSQMWGFDGTNWSTNDAPPPRSTAASCYDSARGRLVYFGGSIPGGPINFIPLGDTWEWDGMW